MITQFKVEIGKGFGSTELMRQEEVRTDYMSVCELICSLVQFLNVGENLEGNLNVQFFHLCMELDQSVQKILKVSRLHENLQIRHLVIPQQLEFFFLNDVSLVLVVFPSEQPVFLLLQDSCVLAHNIFVFRQLIIVLLVSSLCYSEVLCVLQDEGGNVELRCKVGQFFVGESPIALVERN